MANLEARTTSPGLLRRSPTNPMDRCRLKASGSHPARLATVRNTLRSMSIRMDMIRPARLASVAVADRRVLLTGAMQ